MVLLDISFDTTSNKPKRAIEVKEFNEKGELVFVDYMLEYQKGFYSENLVGYRYIKSPSGEESLIFKTKDRDTVMINERVVVFVNPFPNVFYHQDEKIVVADGNPYSGSYSGFLELKNKSGEYYERCVANDSSGTLKRYWHLNRNIWKEGHFWNNKKNGKWQYWNEEGRLIKEEWYDKGKLLREEEY
jgi:antitoxin component YwqK of YwqJK toxin-antitoxin module